MGILYVERVGPPFLNHAHPQSCGLRHCRNAECARRIWDQDVNAACNMMKLFGRLAQALETQPCVRSGTL